MQPITIVLYRKYCRTYVVAVSRSGENDAFGAAGSSHFLVANTAVANARTQESCRDALHAAPVSILTS